MYTCNWKWWRFTWLRLSQRRHDETLVAYITMYSASSKMLHYIINTLIHNKRWWVSQSSVWTVRNFIVKVCSSELVGCVLAVYAMSWMPSLNISCWTKNDSPRGFRTKVCMYGCGGSSSHCKQTYYHN